MTVISPRDIRATAIALSGRAYPCSRQSAGGTANVTVAAMDVHYTVRRDRGPQLQSTKERVDESGF